MNFKEYLTESINDKGLFKAIFLAGSPGAGKTYTLQKIDNPSVQPRIISIDKIHEFMAKKHNLPLSDYETFNKIQPSIKQTFREKVALYINSMLPLWVDGTSSELGSTLRRIGLLESFGYDVAMLWVDTDVEIAIQRARQRERDVPEGFIRKAAAQAQENKDFYIKKIPKFFEAKNNEGELNNEAILKLFNQTSKYFLSPIENPTGKRNIARLREEKQAFLVPSIYSKEALIRAMYSWYKTN